MGTWCVCLLLLSVRLADRVGQSYGTCAEKFGVTSDGDAAAHILALAEVTGQDEE
ncbi:hypothetical protein CALVIDRAFT_543457 [Calocera viscosa TUFC12733]|uniref:Uncharacterized protein n=1 Tax=Calocera viscosa (strain TUFC12733) TaxID=1330018 RepID=A0A167FK11_CALVF|nr:hypothetical protein CALVIDRAFT_543457 [Calocera viscosa TUFC12733]